MPPAPPKMHPSYFGLPKLPQTPVRVWKPIRPSNPLVRVVQSAEQIIAAAPRLLRPLRWQEESSFRARPHVAHVSALRSLDCRVTGAYSHPACVLLLSQIGRASCRERV